MKKKQKTKTHPATPYQVLLPSETLAGTALRSSEGHPGQHDHQGGGESRFAAREEEDVATQREVDVQTVVPACGTQKKQ